MPLHPDALEAIRLAGDLPAGLPLAELRRVYETQRMPLLPEALPVRSAEERSIPSRGGPLKVRIYHPLEQAPDAPLMVFFHGGGWMLASLHSYDTSCRRLAAKAGCVVVSVDYRLAPEHRFPAAVEDAWDAFVWCADHAAELGASRRRLVVCGDSAGGNLAAVVAQLCLDDTRHPIALQALIYPSTDMTRHWPSFDRNASGYMLTAAALRMFFEQYVPDPADRSDPRASPMSRRDIRGLAPALIASAEFDPLVDENAAYARKLEAAGVPVRHVTFAGMLHPFFTLGGVIRDTARLEDLIAAAVRACGLAGDPSIPGLPRDTAATLILHGGTVHTLDADDRSTSALAVAGDRILAVGDDAAMLALRGPDTRVVDLAGRTVVPGLFDAHPHMDRLGLRAHAGLAIADCRSVAAICAAIADAATRTPPGEWIVTLPMGAPPDGYFSEPGQLEEGRFPDRHDLDRAAPDHPVFIRSPWGWWTRLPLPAVANSRALALAGITRDTPSPYRIDIQRDAEGEPTGVFLERNRAPTLEYVLFSCVPRFTWENRYAGLRTASRLTSAAGVTAGFEGHGLTPAVLDAYRQLAAAGELTVRMQAALSVPSAAFGDAAVVEQLSTWAPRLSGLGSASGLLREEGVCLDVADPQVACILACGYPYEHWAGHFYQSLSQERLIALGVAAARLGLRVSVLVCYEIERVLQALEAIDAQVPIRERRWVAVHVTAATAQQIARIKALGLIATVTPGFMHTAKDRFDLHALGAAGTPIRELLDAGVPVALSTDGVPHSMLFAMWEALARWDADSRSTLGPSRLTRLEALRLATVAGHVLTWDETRRGPLAPGMDADFVVLAEDPLTCTLAKLPTLRVDLTVVAGREVYDRVRDGTPALP